MVQQMTPGVMAGLPVDPQSGYYDRTVEPAPMAAYVEQAEVVRGESAGLRAPSRARSGMAVAPAPVVEDESAPAPAEWFDSSSLAETKKAQE